MPGHTISTDAERTSFGGPAPSCAHKPSAGARLSAGGGVTRRHLLKGAAALAATTAAGCTGIIQGVPGDESGPGDDPPGGDGLQPGDTAGPGADAFAGDAVAGDASAGDAGHGDAEVNDPPVWAAIPDQAWVVGVPVYFDLAAYCSDADAFDALTYSISPTLPAGLTLSGSIISGTPTAELATTAFIATADDGH